MSVAENHPSRGRLTGTPGHTGTQPERKEGKRCAYVHAEGG